MDGFHSNTALPLAWSFKVIASRSIRLHWCMGKWITSVCLGADTHLQHGVRQCVITVPKSLTRCQWNAAQGFVQAWLYQRKFRLCTAENSIHIWSHTVYCVYLLQNLHEAAPVTAWVWFPWGNLTKQCQWDAFTFCSMSQINKFIFFPTLIVSYEVFN